MSISKKRQWRNLRNAFQIKTLFPLKKKIASYEFLLKNRKQEVSSENIICLQLSPRKKKSMFFS